MRHIILAYLYDIFHRPIYAVKKGLKKIIFIKKTIDKLWPDCFYWHKLSAFA